MNLLSRLIARPPALPATACRAVPADEAPDHDDGEDGAARGCGWFDSSHELRRGLLVREHASPDAVAAELPLAAWLDLHLSGWPEPASARMPS